MVNNILRVEQPEPHRATGFNAERAKHFGHSEIFSRLVRVSLFQPTERPTFLFRIQGYLFNAGYQHGLVSFETKTLGFKEH